MVTDYHINVFHSEADGGWIAHIPDLKHCSAFGETPEIALHEVLIAKETWIQTAQENGIPVPEAKYRPAIYQVASIH